MGFPSYTGADSFTTGVGIAPYSIIEAPSGLLILAVFVASGGVSMLLRRRFNPSNHGD